METPRETIRSIDKSISSLRRCLRAKEKGLRTEYDYHWAYRRHPHLSDLIDELFRQRGIVQLRRAAADEKAWRMKQARQRRRFTNRARPKKCPQCGYHTLFA